MITRSAAPRQTAWQHALADAVDDPRELLRLVDLDPNRFPHAAEGAGLFTQRVPRGYIARMRKGDPADPLLRQVLPLGEEAVEYAGFVTDPVGDMAAQPLPGLLHKYHGRALLVVTGACGVHCRYCFRRHYPYETASATPTRWTPAVDHLRADPSIEEVILSGGDPLSLADAKLAALIEQLETIPHLRRLRIHTRLPVVVPERVDEALVEWLGETRLQAVVVVHANHARELDGDVVAGLARLRATGATGLNQAVLLRGVNDAPEAQVALAERLFEAGVLPYYLHILDPVQGAAHFHVGDDEAARLMAAVRARLPGYLVPRLVRERPGGAAKEPVVG